MRLPFSPGPFLPHISAALSFVSHRDGSFCFQSPPFPKGQVISCAHFREHLHSTTAPSKPVNSWSSHPFKNKSFHKAHKFGAKWKVLFRFFHKIITFKAKKRSTQAYQRLMCFSLFAILFMESYHGFRTQKAPCSTVCAYTSPANFISQLMQVLYIQYITLFPTEKISKNKNAPGGLVAALREHPICVVSWRTRPLKHPLGRSFRLVPFWHFSAVRFHVTIPRFSPKRYKMILLFSQLCLSQNAQLFQQRFQIFFRRCDRCDAIVFHQEIKDVRRNKCRQRGAKADILNAQIQQRQQNAHGLLLVP